VSDQKNRQKTVPMLTYWTHRYVLVLLASLVILAVVSGISMQLRTYEHIYNLLEMRAEQLSDSYTRSGDNTSFRERMRYEEVERPRFGPRITDVVQVADAQGNVLTLIKDKGPGRDSPALNKLSARHGEVLAGEKVREKLYIDSQTWLRVGVPIIKDGVAVRALYISMPARNILLETRRLYLALALLTGIITLAGWLVLYHLSRRLTRPLREIAAAAQCIAGGRYDPELPDNVKEKELQQLVTSFRNMARQLKQLESLRTDLLAGVSHELRTPITSVRGMVQAVHDRVVTGDEADEFLRITLNESKRLQQMVDELLDFSAFEAGAAPIKKNVIDIKSLAEEVTRQMECSPEFTGIVFELLTPGEPVWVKGDAGRLRQILLNFFNNSRKASATIIKITLLLEKSSIIIDIADNGKGIAPSHQPYIFERFYRGFGGKSGKQGLGLGLTISRLLAEAHGGNIALIHTDGEGTAFSLTLPLAEEG